MLHVLGPLSRTANRKFRSINGMAGVVESLSSERWIVAGWFGRSNQRSTPDLSVSPFVARYKTSIRWREGSRRS